MKGDLTMKDEHEEPWERRPAPGSGTARDEHYAAARKSFLKAKAAHEARQRTRPRRGGLSIAEARRRMAQHGL
jgi:hypothetical protein